MPARQHDVIIIKYSPHPAGQIPVDRSDRQTLRLLQRKGQQWIY